MHTSLLRGRSPCNLTLPVINYLPWLSPFTVNAQKAPIASLCAIKASIGWYQTTLTSSNLSCHCHPLKGFLHFVPRVQLLSVCMMQAEYILLATGSFQSFILSNINKVKGQTGLEVLFLSGFFCFFERCLQLVKYRLVQPKCAELQLCHFISCMTTLLSHLTDYFQSS